MIVNKFFQSHGWQSRETKAGGQPLIVLQKNGKDVVPFYSKRSAINYLNRVGQAG